MPIEWQVAGQTVRGAAHERNGLPNQDAIHWLPSSGHGPSAVLAVADGHGSPRYPRSHTGAAIAVEKSTQLIDEFLQGQANGENLSLIKHAAEEWLPRALVRNWSEAVAEDLKINPLSSDGPSSVRDEPSIAYGTTLLVAAVTERFVLYLQLGDGDILSVSHSGEVTRPLANDDRLFGNETTSLCATDAWRDFRIHFQPLTQSPPALVLLSTDGYPNSFRDDSGFFKVGSDILNMVQENGLANVQDQLAGWLLDSTRAGSGDDITLGILSSLEK
jgi:hypothetical protein